MEGYARRRVVTSCTECYRRKQKCDREHPCNNCVTRDVASKCVYTSSPSHSSASANNIAFDVAKSMDGAEPPSQLGYSSITGSNAFQGLQTVSVSRKQWLRDSRLPPRAVLQQLISNFFSDVNWHYSIVEPYYFDDLFRRWYEPKLEPVMYLSLDDLTRELRCLPALLFQVVALSLQFLPPSAEVLEDLPDSQAFLSENYSETGLKLMSLLGDDATPTAVQSSLLRASWLKNLGRAIDAWKILGTSIRQSQELGLHREHRILQRSSDPVD
ncbi:hypothetical protein BKA64DRAFT_730729 [Cadophora sp. MPI-SDFR-AT-0126]|nr:hypothetical protein BKA64DRAFT_730729 [Leotiomycetes sp. MPI-SDFR-AT-0126]